MKKALLVGINDYDGEVNDLPSCIEDTVQFRKLLIEQYGFKDADIRTLHDKQATTDRVKEEFASLVRGAQRNDSIVFFYSGHGCQVPNGDSLEEALVLYDQPLLDDTLVQMTKGLPEGVLTVVLDSCFSGGMEKKRREPVLSEDGQVFFAKVKHWTPTDKAYAALEEADETFKYYRPFGAAFRRPRAFDPVTRTFKAAPPGGEAGDAQMNGILFSACLETETAAASTPATKGLSAFTHSLIRSVQSSPKQSNRDMYQSTLNDLKSLRFRQTPVLLCPLAPPKADARPFIIQGDQQLSGRSGVIAEWLARIMGPKAASLKAAAPEVPEMSPEEALDAIVTIAPVMALDGASAMEKGFWQRVSRAVESIASNPMVRTMVGTLGSSVLGLSKGQEPGAMSTHEALEAVAMMAPILAEAEGASAQEKGFWSSLGNSLRSIARNPIVRSLGQQLVTSLAKGQETAELPPEEAIEAVAALAPALAAAQGASAMEKGFWSSVGNALRSAIRSPIVRAAGEQLLNSVLSKGYEPATITPEEAVEAVAALAPTLAAAEGASPIEKGFWSSVGNALRSAARSPVVRSLANAAGQQLIGMLSKSAAEEPSELTPEEAIEAIATLAPTLATAEGASAMEKGFWSNVGNALRSAIRNPYVRAMGQQILNGVTKGPATSTLSPEQAIEAVAALAPALAAAESASATEKGFWSSVGNALRSVVRNPVVRTAVGAVAPIALNAVIPGSGPLASALVPMALNVAGTAVGKQNGTVHVS